MVDLHVRAKKLARVAALSGPSYRYYSVVRTHVGTDLKTVKYRLRSLRTPQNLFDRMKNCIERVKLSSGFAVMVFVFAGSVSTARYLRLNKGTCRPSYLPCPLFIQVPHVP